jgi:hypothetical protein
MLKGERTLDLICVYYFWNVSVSLSMAVDFWAGLRIFRIRVIALSPGQSYEGQRLTPWNTVLLDKLIAAQLMKEFPMTYGNRRFVTMFTRGRYWTVKRYR